MTFYRLLVKGPPNKAREEATRRLGARSIVGVSEHYKKRNTTSVEVCVEKDSLGIHNWYGEAAPCGAGIGYPSGVLLFFYESE